MTVSVRKRLKALKLKYGLTISDLALLLSTSRTTVHYWETGERSPYPGKVPLIEKRLALIEKAKNFFPVPLDVTQYQRKTYLLDAINVFSSKLSKSGATARR